MGRTRGPRSRGWMQAWLAGLLAQAFLVAPATSGPRFSGSLGHTFAILGTVHEGAMAFGLNALLPVDRHAGRFGLGLGVWGDDMGEGVEQLLAPQTGANLGAIGGASRFAVGGGLAAELNPSPGSANGARRARGGPFAAGTAGVYYVESQQRGSVVRKDYAPGWNLAAGWRFRIGALGSVGPSLRYTRVFDDRLGRFMSAGLDWAWR